MMRELQVQDLHNVSGGLTGTRLSGSGLSAAWLANYTFAPSRSGASRSGGLQETTQGSHYVENDEGHHGHLGGAENTIDEEDVWHFVQDMGEGAMATGVVLVGLGAAGIFIIPVPDPTDVPAAATIALGSVVGAFGGFTWLVGAAGGALTDYIYGDNVE